MRPDDAGAQAQTWERVLRKVRSGEMPPPGLPRPEPAESAALTAWIEAELDRAAAAKPNPGRPAIHRLNRAEYSNAIRDLLALDIDPGSSLPADDSGYGFDNIADVLSVSPALLEKYLAEARQISRLAVGDTAILPSLAKYSRSQAGNIRHYFPLDAEYSIKVHLRPASADDHASPQLEILVDGTALKLPDPVSEVYETRQRVKAGARVISVGPRAVVNFVEITGPFDATGPGETASRKRVFVCRPQRSSGEKACAKEILSALARRAYRRPVTEADLHPLLSFYATGRRKGTFETGIEMALARMLIAPQFLFRMERDPAEIAPGRAYRISDIDLASRLSFFLWSSIPDDTLLEAAEQDKLHQPGVFTEQVERMLQDPRSVALVKNFAGQWLYLRNLALVKPDPEAFPDFDESLRAAFQQETELFLETIFREDRSAIDLLDADFTFVNERLARHYKIADVHGSEFRRVTLSGTERRGLLGQGSILTVTSYANRTSPVLRGKWILENLLGSPPPPPPANVPDLKAHGEDGRRLSLRDQMQRHRTDAICSGCHARMDPLGFALENFDGVGHWRIADEAGPIDASGALPDGASFDGPWGLTKVLVSRRDEFAATLSAKLLTYALGRGLEYYDQPEVRAITREAARADYRISALILAITRSTPFQMRRSEEP